MGRLAGLRHGCWYTCVMTMAKLMFGRLSEAWQGEATDFTPLLADQLDNLGDALGIDLAAVGKSEVLTMGGRRIDIVAQGEDGSEFVIENQYGRADHDHLTRGWRMRWRATLAASLLWRRNIETSSRRSLNTSTTWPNSIVNAAFRYGW